MFRTASGKLSWTLIVNFLFLTVHAFVLVYEDPLKLVDLGFGSLYDIMLQTSVFLQALVNVGLRYKTVEPLKPKIPATLPVLLLVPLIFMSCATSSATWPKDKCEPVRSGGEVSWACKCDKLDVYIEPCPDLTCGTLRFDCDGEPLPFRAVAKDVQRGR